MNLKAVLEGLLFLVGDEGIDMKDICDILETDEENVKCLINELQKEYTSPDKGIIIKKFGDNYKLTTKKEHKEYYQRLIERPESDELSSAALETLAIIAYNGPLTRLEIDQMRGVSSAYTLRKLLAKDLIYVSGKSDLVGKPNLYSVSKYFLDFFGLGSLSDLPKIESTLHPDNGDDLYYSMYKEDNND